QSLAHPLEVQRRGAIAPTEQAECGPVAEVIGQESMGSGKHVDECSDDRLEVTGAQLVQREPLHEQSVGGQSASRRAKMLARVEKSGAVPARVIEVAN